jgi:hypothetical protein
MSEVYVAVRWVVAIAVDLLMFNAVLCNERESGIGSVVALDGE